MCIPPRIRRLLYMSECVLVLSYVIDVYYHHFRHQKPHWAKPMRRPALLVEAILYQA